MSSYRAGYDSTDERMTLEYALSRNPGGPIWDGSPQRFDGGWAAVQWFLPMTECVVMRSGDLPDAPVLASTTAGRWTERGPLRGLRDQPVQWAKDWRPDYVKAVATGRWERRDYDGALAEVYETVPYGWQPPPRRRSRTLLVGGSPKFGWLPSLMVGVR